MSEIKFVPRGFADNLVLLPGWATDCRIFGCLDLNYNYLLPFGFSSVDFPGWLKGCLDERGIKKVSLLGWSLGGFLAADFASRYPEKVDELILSGIREKYDPDYLRQTADKLRKNKRAWLYRFYSGLFSESDSESKAYFKKELSDDFIGGMSVEELIQGLNYLAQAGISRQPLAKIKKIRIFHGEFDAVAPLEEARKISSGLLQSEFITLAGLGHCLFLNERFRKVFYG